MSKLQNIADEVIDLSNKGESKKAILKLLEAIELLAKGQIQLMDDIEKLNNVNRYRTDIPIK